MGSQTLVPLDIVVAELPLLPRGTLRVWKHRGRLLPVACDVTTRAELYDFDDAATLERDTRDERIRRMTLTYAA